MTKELLPNEMPEQVLDIDTSGWIKITCDKCGTTSSYNVKSIDDIKQCFGCMPLRNPEDVNAS